MAEPRAELRAAGLALAPGKAPFSETVRAGEIVGLVGPRRPRPGALPRDAGRARAAGQRRGGGRRRRTGRADRGLPPGGPRGRRLPAARPAGDRHLPGAVDPRQFLDRHPRPRRARRADQQPQPARTLPAVPRAARDRRARRAGADHRALRRQPAEGAARPLARARPALPPPQRPDPRRRHRHPAHALRRVPRARRRGGGAGGALLRDRGDRRALPPRPRLPRERAVRDARPATTSPASG